MLVALVVLGSCLSSVAWTLSSPAGSSPDEHAHIVYAWGTATGQTLPWSHAQETEHGAGRIVDVDVPATLLETPEVCYSFQPEQQACAEGTAVDDSDGDGEVDSSSNMARYPWAYYLVVGLVMRGAIAAGATGDVAVNLAQIVSGLMSMAAVMLAVALLARRFPARSAVALGAAVLTPMVLFLSSSINPNGFEVAITVLVAACVVSVREDGARGLARSRPLAVLLVVASLLLGLTRPASAIWLVALYLVLVLPLRGESWLRPWRRLGPWLLAALVAALAVAAAAFLYNNASRGGGATGKDLTEWDAVPANRRWILVLLRFGPILRSGYTDLGWTDTLMPSLFMFAWVIGVSIVFAPHRARPGAPSRTRALAASLLFVGLGLAAVAVNSEISAFAWQGRYVLPVIMGFLTLLVATTSTAPHDPALDPSLDRTGEGARSRLRRATPEIILVLVQAGIAVCALVINVLRYVFGFMSTYAHFDSLPFPQNVPLDWVPVISVRYVCALGVLAAVLLVAAALGLIATRPEPSPMPALAGEDSDDQSDTTERGEA